MAIQHAESPQDIALVRELFLEYARSLDFELCFQSFEAELASLPGSYAPPQGALLLARSNAEAAGCVALRPLTPEVCEMKRLYVRPAFRGHRLGRNLVEELIALARAQGYRSMRLDTVPRLMGKAVELYQELGFRAAAPYYPTPVEGTFFMELDFGDRGRRRHEPPESVIA